MQSHTPALQPARSPCAQRNAAPRSALPERAARWQIPESELELRKLRAQCVEQEDMIVGLLDSIENVDHLLRDDSDGADTE